MNDIVQPISGVAIGKNIGSSRSLQLLLLSAQNAASLDHVTANLVECFQQHQDLSLADVAYTLQRDYSSLAHRRMLVCHDRADACEALTVGNPKRVLTGIANRTDRPVAFLFPGLGDHYVGMAEQLYQQEAVFREHIDRCAELLVPFLRRDLRDELYPDRHRMHTVTQSSTLSTQASPRGPDLRRMLRRTREQDVPLNQTYLAHPVLFVVEYALAQLLISWGVQPQAMLGYSLGEYVAACLAGVFSLEDALALVAQRAQMIQALPLGLMLAVSLSEQEVSPLLGEGLSLSAINGSELCVVGGPVAAIESLELQLTKRDIISYRLQTSHAFHSRMMEPIAADFINLVKTFSLHPPRIPYLSNVTGTWITATEATNPAYWAQHLCQTVRLNDSIQALWEEAAHVLVEVGPGQTLSSQALQYSMKKQSADHVTIPSLRAAYDQQNDDAVLLTALGRLWLAGVTINWQELYASEKRQRLTLPVEDQHQYSPVQPYQAPIAGPSRKEYAFASLTKKHRLGLLTPYAEPATVTEKKIAAIWQDVLNIERVGIHDNFFELGGHSLLAIRIISFLNDVLQVNVPLQVVFSANTVADLAQVIDKVLGAQETDELFDSDYVALLAGLDEPYVTAHSNQLNYELPNHMVIVHQNKAETDHFYEDIFEHEVYAQHGIAFDDGACIFDVGANIGLFTLYAQQKCRNARIYAFEPAPQLFNLLQENVSRFQVGARLFNYGLSNAAKTAQFTFYPFSSGMSSFYADKEEEKAVLTALLHNQVQQGKPEMEQVMSYSQELLNERLKSQELTCHLRPLSEVISEHKIDRIDLLKIDVQKSELDVLAGIRDEDWDKIQQIVMEIHNIENRVVRIADLLQRHGCEVIIEQDALYKGSIMYNVSALRKR